MFKNFYKNLHTPLYERLDQNKNIHTELISSHEDFLALLQKLRPETNKKPIEIVIGGGGLFGIMSGKILQKIKKENIQVASLTGNSIGAILSVLYSEEFFTDEEEFQKFFLKAKEDSLYTELISRENLILKLLPFTLHLTKNQKYFFMHSIEKFKKFISENEDYEAIIKKSSDFRFEDKLAKIIQNYLRTHHFTDISEKTGKKLNCNDIEAKTKRKIGFHVTLLNRPSCRDGIFLRKKILTGDFPVLDALLMSAAPNRIEKIFSKKYGTLIGTDGYYSGNFISQNTIKNSIKILIQTDDDWWLTRILTADYERDINYVIRPNLLGWESSNAFTKDNINHLQFLAKMFVDGN